ncbi:hypothetical protein, partial [Corynebacterium qintianiae]|uniref:hypothetical protein n=1 Tax=Corynebacterium qintianiae TaxID=2709392 RepID=UPI001981145E
PRSNAAIKGSRHHHRHTPTHTQHNVTRRQTHHNAQPTNHKQKIKSTLAHYRVLTQHTPAKPQPGKMNLHNHPTQSQTAMKLTTTKS